MCLRICEFFAHIFIKSKNVAKSISLFMRLNQAFWKGVLERRATWKKKEHDRKKERYFFCKAFRHLYQAQGSR